MNDQPHATQNMPDLAELSRALASISVRPQCTLAASMHHHLESNALPEADPRNIGKALILPICQIMANPAHMVKSHIGLW